MPMLKGLLVTAKLLELKFAAFEQLCPWHRISGWHVKNDRAIFICFYDVLQELTKKIKILLSQCAFQRNGNVNAL